MWNFKKNYLLFVILCLMINPVAFSQAEREREQDIEQFLKRTIFASFIEFVRLGKKGERKVLNSFFKEYARNPSFINFEKFNITEYSVKLHNLVVKIYESPEAFSSLKTFMENPFVKKMHYPLFSLKGNNFMQDPNVSKERKNLIESIYSLQGLEKLVSEMKNFEEHSLKRRIAELLSKVSRSEIREYIRLLNNKEIYRKFQRLYLFHFLFLSQ